MSEPLFIAVADTHLSENPPTFRSGEPDWFAAQAKQLRWLSNLGKNLGCPIVIAGDIFDKATGTTRLVNFVVDELPCCYAIAGNHDLPYHNLEKLSISSYGTLMRARKIYHVDNIIRFTNKNVSIALHGFSYGVPFRNCQKVADIDVAVIHHYVWTGVDSTVLGRIMADSHVSNLKRSLVGYDYYVFGDNHCPFDDGNVVNCGSFYRRTKGDEHYQPMVVVFYADHYERVPVPVDDDIMMVVDNKVNEVNRYEFAEFFESLRRAETMTCDVRQLLHNYLETHEVNPNVRDAIVSITESQ